MGVTSDTATRLILEVYVLHRLRPWNERAFLSHRPGYSDMRLSVDMDLGPSQSKMAVASII